MTIGTSGWWGGWLSGGEVVYKKDSFLMDHELNKGKPGKVVVADHYPEEWVGLGDGKPAMLAYFFTNYFILK